jgi:voltage-gated potassium channel
MRNLTEAVTERREELLLSLMLATIILVFSATAMYILEGENDPEAFGGIPRALWWSVCTLTTVGYGDIYPHSVLGKICLDGRNRPYRDADWNPRCCFQ